MGVQKFLFNFPPQRKDFKGWLKKFFWVWENVKKEEGWFALEKSLFLLGVHQTLVYRDCPWVFYPGFPRAFTLFKMGLRPTRKKGPKKERGGGHNFALGGFKMCFLWEFFLILGPLLGGGHSALWGLV